MRRGCWFAGLCSVVVLVFLSGSCAPPLSELFIGAATDLSAPDVLDRVILSARREGVEVVHNEWDITGIPGMPYQLPGSFNVYTDDGSEPRVELVLSGYRGEKEIVRRRALVTLVRGERKFLRMALVNRCVNNLDCPGGRTCMEGRCVPAEVDPLRLPAYQPGMEETMSCSSGTVLINTGTGQPMAMTGSGRCGEGERCGEGTCIQEEPSCRDGVRNGDETDVDCGGRCAGCGRGKRCGVDGDCAVEACVSGVCATPVRCGDGKADASAGEACDDGNTTTETSCPYGQATCTQCNANCTALINLAGPYCGDGVRNGPEACDDANNLACGTCNMPCTSGQDGTAIGSITVTGSNRITDGSTFTLNDGVHPPTIFEFDPAGNGVSSGRVRIVIGGGANSVGLSVAAAINAIGSTLHISATVTGHVVRLTNDLPGGFGNQPITETVADRDFAVRGMSGGAGHDCPANTGCTTDADCGPGLSCQGARLKTCQPRSPSPEPFTASSLSP